jgi:S-adenosylmethionine:tRNA-ribosyltransferase-isomerase (queuine synthetase)
MGSQVQEVKKIISLLHPPVSDLIWLLSALFQLDFAKRIRVLH